MRILIHSINFKPEPISTGKYTGEMAEWLAERGHYVRVVTSPPHYPQWRIFDGYSSWRFTRERHPLRPESGGALEVFRCPVWVPRQPRAWRRLLYLSSFSVSSLPTMLRQVSWQPDVVLLVEPTFLCSPQTLCVARMCGAISWLHVQDFEVDVAFKLKDFSSGRLKRLAYWLEGVVLRRFDRVSSISNRMVERLAAKDVASTRAVLFPNWVDTTRIRPLSNNTTLRQELGIQKDKVIALYSGNMGLKQGLNLLAETCQKLSSRDDIQFLFCGDGPYRETLTCMTGHHNNVKFLPLQPLDKFNELLNSADIHLLPQLADAEDLVMPSKLTGMMASGRPVVGTAHPGTELHSALQGRGFATCPGDVESFAAAISHLAGDPDLRRQMGSEARKYAVERMGRDEILKRFELSLLEACGHLISGAQQDPIRSDDPIRAGA